MFKKLYQFLFFACSLIFLSEKSFGEETLFNYINQDQPSLESTSVSAVVSRHAVKVNKSAIKNNIKLKLPNGKIIKIKIEKKKKLSSNLNMQTISYNGFIKDDVKRKGTFRLSVTNGNSGDSAVNGMIRTKSGEVFIIKQKDTQSQEFIQLDESKQIECTHEAHRDLDIPNVSQKEVAHLKNVSIKSDTTITVLVAYTPDAITTAGSLSALQSIINDMVSNANLAHSNSHTGVTYSLVGIVALTRNSTDNFSQDLSSASNSSDGVWDELQTLREEYCADQVSVVVGGTNNQTICGIAWLGGNADNMPYYKDSMYSIISANQEICSYLTFAHELGHNLGSAHDYANSGGSGAYDYSFGYRFTGTSNQQYRTVMAYAPGTRIPYFSNPNISYDGAATGTSSANNAASIALTSPVVAAFYGDGATCSSHSPLPITTPPTTSPSTEPDSISLSIKSKNKKTTYKAKTTTSGTPVSGASVSLYYDKTGYGGFTKTYASGTTDTDGILKFTKKQKRGYYIACYGTLCSSAKKSK